MAWQDLLIFPHVVDARVEVLLCDHLRAAVLSHQASCLSLVLDTLPSHLLLFPLFSDLDSLYYFRA